MDSKSQRTSGITRAATSTGALRPRFRERQVLRAADLEAEQSYLIAARRRHNIGQHGWGIVQGLEISGAPILVVQPGVAVDGYGRELIVHTPIEIPLVAFTELADDMLDVWLVYKLAGATVPQQGTWSCGPGKNSRTREQAFLRLTSATQGGERLPIEVPRNPMEVPSADLPFLPYRTPPDDPASEWPVYLGTIRRVPLPPANDARSPRPYATLTGELVTSPSGRARMQVGSEVQSDTRRFSVNTPDSSGKFTERVSIDPEGNTFFRGNTTIASSEGSQTASTLRMRTGDKGKINIQPLATTPAAAAPWEIYRTSVKQDNRTIQQLRLEIGHPGDKGDPRLFQFSIGTRNANGVFVSCFTLSADCTLTIEGDVTVGNQLVEGAIQPDASDPRFGALLANQWVQGTKIGEQAATTGTIQGIVLDRNGAVVPNLTVKLKKIETSVTTNLTTNEAGRFVAPQVLTGKYQITAEAPGFISATKDVELAASETIDVTLILDEAPPTTGGDLQGIVQDPNGATVPGATVTLRNLDTGVSRTVTTDTQGTFRVTNLGTSPYRISVVVSGFDVTVVDNVVATGQTLIITLTLPNPTPP